MTFHTRELPLTDVRAVRAVMNEDGKAEETEFEFVAATDAPVRVFDPIRGRVVRERLNMEGLDLRAYQGGASRRGVVLDTHRKEGTEWIVGDARVRVEGNLLIARVDFTEATGAGKRNLRLVREGKLRTLSIGYEVTESKDLGMQERGDPLVEATAWALREVSTAPVPADPDAQLRAYQEAAMADRSGVVVHDPKKEKRQDEDDDKDDKAEERKGKRAEDEDDEEDDKGKAKRKRKRADEDDDGDDKKGDKDKPKADDRAIADDLAARGSRILAICPPALREYAEKALPGWLLEDVDFDTARARLLTEWQRSHKPVGTPPPNPETDTAITSDANTTHKRSTDPTADDLGRLFGARSL